MRIIGLTGSIAMGKSTTAAMLKRQGIPLHDSDASVHRLMAKGGRAVGAIAAEFPEAVIDGRVDRAILGGLVLGHPERLRKLETILHPLVRQETVRFLKRCCRQRRQVVVLDVPLLFETKADQRVDAVLVVSAPAWLQRQRVLSRPNMTEAKLKAILAKQTPDTQKRRWADAVIPTGLGKAVTHGALVQTLRRWRKQWCTPTSKLPKRVSRISPRGQRLRAWPRGYL